MPDREPPGSAATTRRRSTLVQGLAAREPPELRGLVRSDVRLMVIDRATGNVEYTKFGNLASFLRVGDLLVFNSSRTLPALLTGREVKTGNRMEVRLAECLPDGTWLALLLCLTGAPFDRRLAEGMWIDFGQGLACRVQARDRRIPRLWRVSFTSSGAELLSLIYKLGRPIFYEHASSRLGLEYYQNVYANQPGSMEMPSAGRAFTWKMLLDLKRTGVRTANLVLHTGLSSYMDDELDSMHLASEEQYHIEPSEAEKVNSARSEGNRVLAVGTTVVRALESASNGDGSISPGHGYTRLHITLRHRLRAVDGLLTGLHEPEASHLDLLRAFLPEDVLRDAYQEAARRGYLWHEFGDLNLII